MNRSATRGNQNARKHGYCSRVLGKASRVATDLAAPLKPPGSRLQKMAQKKTLFDKLSPQAAAYLLAGPNCFQNNSLHRYKTGPVVWFIWLQLEIRCQARGRLACKVNNAEKRALLLYHRGLLFPISMRDQGQEELTAIGIGC